MEGWFTVGTVAPSGTIYICEGVGQAWACWQATQNPAIVAFGWGRVRRVTEALNKLYPLARLVLVPDVGKEKEATQIAQDVGTALACIPEGEAENFDVNDLTQRDGIAVLAGLLTSANANESNHPLTQFVSIGTPPKAPRWVIPGFIGHGVVVVAGAHGVGKTTALLPLAMVTAVPDLNRNNRR